MRLTEKMENDEQIVILTTQIIRIIIAAGGRIMITKEQKEIIKKHVPGKYYDKEKLLGYLKIHDVVGNEIFEYVDKHKDEDGEKRPAHSIYLEDEAGYRPLSVDAFIRRVPFFFYKGNWHDGKLGELHFLLSDLNRNEGAYREYPPEDELEQFYRDG